MSAPWDDPVDRLGITDDQLAILSEAVPLTAQPVDERVADRVYEAGDGGEGTLAGAVRVRVHAAPKCERVTAYRFQRRGILNEHLFHAWPGEGFDFPALTTVIFEMQPGVILGADLIPIADVAFYPEYYGLWYGEMTSLTREFWPRIVEHMRTPAPPPDPYFTNQLGSRLAILADLTPEGLPVAREYLLALTRLWTHLWSRAEPTPEPQRERAEARRSSLMSLAYKGLDYHSPAAPSLAAVLGWAGANLMFDSVFGPDPVPQPAGERRTYLGVDVSPGTAARQEVRASEGQGRD